MEVTTAPPQMAMNRASKAARPLRTFASQVVREYRDKVAERLLRRELRKPWMKYREIGIIEDLLVALRPMRVLEWGAGYGTPYFARFLPPGGRWIAVEHDRAWAERIRAHRKDVRVRVHFVPPESEDWRVRDKDGTYPDFRAYVDYPDKFGPYDLIIVDGRARETCLEKASGMLAPGGVAVLHDANRSYRRAPGGAFPSEAEFRDYRRWSGGLWIGSKDRPLPTVLDLGRHGRIWRMYNSLGKGFHL